MSVKTAEAAAAAKVFIETYYNNLLSDSQPPRNLRLTRALSSNSGRSEKRPSDKYEVIRILGKGSFGVVKLVKEKPLSMIAQISCHDHARMNGVSHTMASPGSHDCSTVRNQLYAMKVIRKADMVRNCQEGHIRAERDFLVASGQSRWVVPLVASFQEHDHLYLVMEYQMGGDFLSLLMREDILKEEHARNWLAQMVLCLEAAHKMKWIHRDVKPDNFLISKSGHLKISDFGLSFDGHWSHHQQYYNDTRESLVDLLGIRVTGDQKDMDDDTRQQATQNQANATCGINGFSNGVSNGTNRTYCRAEGDLLLDKLNTTGNRRLAKSVVGTTQYMAPEVAKGDYYDGRCDWWSIGIILYEVRCIVFLWSENVADQHSAFMERHHSIAVTETRQRQRLS